MSLILAIDPGSKTSGWVLVRRELARVRYVTSGTMDSTVAGMHQTTTAIVNLLGRATLAEVSAVAIEVAEGFIHQPFRGPFLLATAEMVGIITAVSDGLSLPVVRLTAGQVRKSLVGKASSPKKGVLDRLVGDAVRANVVGWPVESNVHGRDAAALAIVANWQLVSRRVA